MEPVALFNSFAEDGDCICVLESVFTAYISPHEHNFMEIVFVCQGEGYHLANGGSTAIARGDLLLLPADMKHSFQAVSKDLKWRNCIFLPERLYCPELAGPAGAAAVSLCDLFRAPPVCSYFTFPDKPVDYIHIKNKYADFQYLFHEMLSEYTNKEVGYRYNLRMMLDTLLIKIARIYLQDKKQRIELNAQNLVDIVFAYLQNFSAYPKINLEELAKKANVSPKYFSKIFKEKVGQNLTDFIRDYRLKYAAELLVNSDITVVEIMLYAGYQDSKYFYEIFTEKYGMTPAKFRKKHRERGNPL